MTADDIVGRIGFLILAISLVIAGIRGLRKRPPPAQDLRPDAKYILLDVRTRRPQQSRNWLLLGVGYTALLMILGEFAGLVKYPPNYTDLLIGVALAYGLSLLTVLVVRRKK